MSRYKILFFDLDNTLLDFHISEYNAIKTLLKMHGLPDSDKEAKLYSDINLSFWERFERGEIKREEIFEWRFIVLAEALGVTADTAKMSKDYFSLLSAGHDVMEGAEDILIRAKQKGFIICAATNGIAFTQYRRIKESGLEPYFDFVAVSEEAGFQKPDKRYFDYALKMCGNPDKKEVLIIGDSQSSDILGGINAGIDTCWFNPKGSAPTHPSTFEIKSLSELKSIL